MRRPLLMMIRDKKPKPLPKVVEKSGNSVAMTHFSRLMRTPFLSFLHRPIVHRESLSFLSKFTFIVLISVYTLVLLGATVRASGSGMGCPDWPTCFGRIIPPISASQLPENYQELYAPKLANEQVLEEFNVQKTWTEYLNRLFGVLVGLLSLTLLSIAFMFRKSYAKLYWLSLGVFVLICFQGGLGAVVVATNLLPGMITAHMLMALIILCLLIYLLFTIRQIQADTVHRHWLENNHKISIPHLKMIYLLTSIAFGAMVLQILMGTQVREMVDFASRMTTTRSDWVGLLSEFFYVHRSFSWIIIMLNSVLLWHMYKHIKPSRFFYLQLVVMIFILLQILSGSFLNHLDFPVIIQPFHLLSATIILGIQFSVLLNIRNDYRKRLFVRSFD